MIVRGGTPRGLSRLGLVAVVVLGGVLLPWLPGRAQPAATAGGDEAPVEVFGTWLPQAAGFFFNTYDPPGPAAPTGPAGTTSGPQPNKVDRQTAIRAAQEAADGVELLKLQLEAKEAELKEATALVEQAKIEADGLARSVTSATTGQERNKLVAEATKAQAGIRVQEARLLGKHVQVREAKLRLEHAQRRLADLNREPAPAASRGNVPVVEMGRWNVTWAEALFDERVKDLGAVRNEFLKGEFRMVNRGKDPVTIAGVRSSEWFVRGEATPKELPPGHQGAVQFFINAAQMAGRKEFVFRVQFSKPEPQEVQLVVKADVRWNLPAAAPPDNRGVGGPPNLHEVQKRLDTLLKEVESLRQELRKVAPDGPQSTRTKRQLRWIMAFNPEDGHDYLRKLRDLGAAVVYPGPDGQYRVIRDLNQRPPQLKSEDLTGLDMIYWIESKPEWVASLADALRLPDKPAHISVFFPKKLEDQLLAMEKRHLPSGSTEDDIEETRFEVRRHEQTYVPVLKDIRLFRR
jgi:hypothetical protein